MKVSLHERYYKSISRLLNQRDCTLLSLCANESVSQMQTRSLPTGSDASKPKCKILSQRQQAVSAPPKEQWSFTKTDLWVSNISLEGSGHTLWCQHFTPHSIYLNGNVEVRWLAHGRKVNSCWAFTSNSTLTDVHTETCAVAGNGHSVGSKIKEAISSKWLNICKSGHIVLLFSFIISLRGCSRIV